MITRRSFMHFTSAALSTGALSLANAGREAVGQPSGAELLGEGYPAYPPDLIRKIVTVSHFSLDKVKEIVGPHPQLVKASWDWGFGDWETPLGAACHMGRKDIAEYLLSNGASASIFSSVLFGNLGLVKQIVESNAGIERVAGPHSISLLAHARMGGAPAQGVFSYLQSLGDADMATPAPVAEKEMQMICGSYRFGSGDSQVIEVSSDMKAYANTPMYTYKPQLNWKRSGTMERPLFHRGDLTFYPAGAASTQIRFEQGTGSVVVMTVTDGGEVLRASRGLTG